MNRVAVAASALGLWLALGICRQTAVRDPPREVNKPLYVVPHFKGIVGNGASFAKHLADRMKAEGIKPGLADHAGATLAAE